MNNLTRQVFNATILSLPGEGALDTTPPTYVSSNVEDAAPSTIIVLLSENIVSPTSDYKSGWTIKYDAVSETINTATRQVDNRYIYFAMANPVTAGVVVTIEYAKASGDITDVALNELEDITAQTVTNNVGANPGRWDFSDSANSTYIAFIG